MARDLSMVEDSGTKGLGGGCNFGEGGRPSEMRSILLVSHRMNECVSEFAYRLHIMGC